MLVPESELRGPATVGASANEVLLIWQSAHDGLVEVALPTYRQPGVVVAAARWARERRGERVRVFPLLEVPEHALGRMFQRAPGIGGAGALIEACRGFLAADYEAIEAARLKGRRWSFPPARGAFYARRLGVRTCRAGCS